MKKVLYKRWRLFIALLIIGSVAIAGIFANMPKKYVEFTCQSQNITAIFFGNNVMLSFTDGTSFKLPRVKSASGARFANHDEGVVFWTKGEGAIYKAPGATESVPCILDNGQS